MPVLLAGSKPHNVAGVNFFDGSSPALGAATSGHDNEGLAEWVSVPGGARAGLEGDVCADRASRFGGIEERIDTNLTGEVFGGT